MGNMFNLFGAGGGKTEGLYIWKKYKYIEGEKVNNPTFSFSSDGGYYPRISLSDYDLTKLPQAEEGGAGSTPITVNTSENAKAIIDFFNGFYNTEATSSVTSAIFKKGIYGSNTAESLYIDVDGKNYWISGYNFMSATKELYLRTANLNLSCYFRFDGYKQYPASIGDFIGYVVSDDPDAYPDKAEQDGFYYEKVELATEAFGCTKFETGSFTVTSNGYSKSVNHSLGVIPKFSYVWTDGTSRASSLVTAYTVNGNGGAGMTLNAFGSSYSGGGGSATESTCTFMTYGSSGYYFNSGQTYNYILLG